MAKIPGLNITAPVVPSQDTDTYPSHRAIYGYGGWREVATVADRDAIPSLRREAGMSVYVTSEKKLYILNSDLVTWSLFSAGGVVEMPAPSETELGNIVQYIGETTEDYIQGYFYKCISDGAEPATYSWEQIDVQPATDLIWGNIEGDITNQEDLNTELTSLQDQIDSLSGRGRYLTLWNCSTGLAETNPPESPYTYKAGDYFIVGTVAASGETNYRPDGTSYTTGVASTTIETEEVSVDDTYIFDGTTWHLQYNSQKTVTFTNIDGDPYDNTNLANALNSKVDKTDGISKIYGTDSEGNQTTYDMTIFGQIDNVAVHGVDQTIINKRVDLSVVEQVNSLPTASETIVGRVVQYTGSDTQDLVHNYFYECKLIYTDETTVVKSASVQLTASADLNTFAQSGLEYNTPYLYEKRGAYWDCIDPEGITITGPRAGLVLGGIVNNNDQVILQVDREFVWEQVNVQPQTDLVWGNITGTLSDQTDLQGALDSKQDALTPGNNITIAEDAQTGDLVISSTSYESLFKGKYNTWNDVPTVGANYPLYIDDGVHTHEPTYTDYMVVVDASTVPGGQVPIVITFKINTYASTGSVKTNIDGTEYNGYGSFDGKVQVRTDVSSGNYGTQFVVLGEDIEYQGTTYHQGEVFLEILHNRVVYGQEYTYNAQLSLGYPYEGTWRFSYRGVWATDNRNGWKGEYPIEQELPIASDTVAGITKLYNTTGQNTDGAVDQATVTTELGKKQDTLTEGTGISIDENNVISATFSESYFRGKFSTWNTVPTDYRNYYPDYTGSTKPTRTDYMVVEDPSSYVKPGDPIYIYQLPWQQPFAYVRIVFGATDVTLNHQQTHENSPIIGTVGNQMRVEYDNYQWKIIPLDIPVIVDGVEKPINEVAYSWSYNSGSSEYLQKELNFKGTSGYVGTWRFSYQSDNWDATGKNGWYPEYQIEDILPIATDTDAGIMKLYTTTGSNTDGTMDQSSITTELEILDTNKQDVLTNASNAGEGIIIDDVTQEISTNNIVWRKW